MIYNDWEFVVLNFLAQIAKFSRKSVQVNENTSRNQKQTQKMFKLTTIILLLIAVTSSTGKNLVESREKNQLSVGRSGRFFWVNMKII